MEDSKRGSGRALVRIAPCLWPKPPGQHPQQRAARVQRRRRSPWARICPPARLGCYLCSCGVESPHPGTALKGHRALPSPPVPRFHPTLLPRGELTPAPCEMHQILETGAGRHLETCERVAQVHRVAQIQVNRDALSASTPHCSPQTPSNVCAQSLQACPTLCNPMDHNPPGSSVPGILQARILEWVATPSSQGSSQLRDPTRVSCLLHRQAHLYHIFTTGATWKPPPCNTSQEMQGTCLATTSPSGHESFQSCHNSES